MRRYVLIIGGRRFLRITKKRALELSKVTGINVFHNEEDNRYYVETANVGGEQV